MSEGPATRDHLKFSRNDFLVLQPTRSSIIESLRQERPSGQAVQRCSHLLQNRLGGRLGGQVVHLFAILAQVKQFFVNVPFLADVRPLAVLQGPQRRTPFGNAPEIAMEGVVRGHLGETGRSGLRLDLWQLQGWFQNRDSDSPGKGASRCKPASSTIVAAMSRRLTASLTVCFGSRPPGGIMIRGTRTPSRKDSCRGKKLRHAHRNFRHGRT